VVGAPIPVTAMDPKAVTPAEFEAAVNALHAKYCTGEARRDRSTSWGLGCNCEAVCALREGQRLSLWCSVWVLQQDGSLRALCARLAVASMHCYMSCSGGTLV
jgi:hypothetical protein